MKVLELLQEAKKLYLNNQGKVGMCWCIKVTANLIKVKKSNEIKDIFHILLLKLKFPNLILDI